MRNLLLVSNSTQHGYGYLEHCAEAVKSLFAGADDLLFVPYALHGHDAYAATAIEQFAKFGFRMTSVHTWDQPADAVAEAGGVFIGGGNTFRLAKALHDSGLAAAIHRRGLQDGMPYMGTSAGSNVACASIRTTNDMPIVYPPTFDGIQLVPFQINPHYVDPDPDSTHMGETRETRICEFHEENEQPVVGLREGAWLRVVGDRITLEGTTGARLFRRNQSPEECASGRDMSDLLLSPFAPRK